jgi:hypothetical protein
MMALNKGTGGPSAAGEVSPMIGKYMQGFTAVLHFYLNPFVDGNDMRESGNRGHIRMDNIDSTKPLHCDTIAVSRSAVEHDDH